jgi:hypothetical protein
VGCGLQRLSRAAPQQHARTAQHPQHARTAQHPQHARTAQHPQHARTAQHPQHARTARISSGTDHSWCCCWIKSSTLMRVC